MWNIFKKKEKTELEELDEIQNIFNDIKPRTKRFKWIFYCDYKFKKPYRNFFIIPSFGFIIDSQFKEGIPNRMKGSMEYTIYLDIFVWSLILTLDIENKELNTEDEK